MSQSFTPRLLAIAALFIGLTAAGSADRSSLPSPDVALSLKGAVLYKENCAECHAMARTGGTTNGPNLWGVLGSKAGKKPGFPYSEALAASGLVWDDATLDKWLEDPATTVPDNMMGFIGLKKADERAAIIAYLETATRGE
jgi:cytochrome c